MPFKIVETTECGKSFLTTVPAQWEQRGTLYWPRSKEATLVMAEDSMPEINWKSMPCILKRNNIPTYQKSEREIALMSDMSDTDHTDQEDIAKKFSRRPKTSTRVINFNDLVTECISENTSSLKETQVRAEKNVMMKDKNASFVPQLNHQVLDVIEVPGTSAEIVAENCDYPTVISLPEPYNQATGIPEISAEKIDSIADKLDHLTTMASANEVNLQVLFDNQQNILQKLALMDTKYEEFVTRMSVPITDINRQGNNHIDFKIISNLQELTSFEERLSDPQAEENIIKLLSVTCTKGKGRAYNNAYALVDAMFTRQFMTQCSWAGGTRGEPKICFKAYTKTTTLFFKIIHQSDNSFTIPECELFLKNVMRHAIKRNTAKLLRASAQKKRPKKLNVLQENNRQTVEEHRGIQNVEQENTPYQQENVSPLDLS